MGHPVLRGREGGVEAVKEMEKVQLGSLGGGGLESEGGISPSSSTLGWP